jgi:hypothetical protein
VNGQAGGLDGSDSYDESLTPSPGFGDFAGGVSDSAYWTDTTPWYPGQDPGWSRAESSAIQNSTLGNEHFYSSSLLIAKGRVSLQGPYGPLTCIASSFFDVTFMVHQRISYELTWSFAGAVLSGSLTPSLWDTTFYSETGDDVLGPVEILEGGIRRYSGSLDSGVYTLRMVQSVSLLADPLGALGYVSSEINFNIVPEPTALTLLSLGSLVLVFARRRTN